MTPRNEAESRALALMQGAPIIVDLQDERTSEDPTVAEAAMLLLLDMAKRGMCVHERISETVGMFSLPGWSPELADGGASCLQ